MKKIIIYLCMFGLINSFAASIYAQKYDENHPELEIYGLYIDDSYDLEYDFSWSGSSHLCLCWWKVSNKFDDTISLYFLDPTDGYISDRTVRIPDTVNGQTVTEFYKSGAFKAFDVNPENPYFKSDGQTVFSKDGKKLLAYAQFNESTEYTLPQGTEIIRDSAFWGCNNITTLYIPDSIKKIEEFSLAYMNSLKAIVFESFTVKIDRSAFGAIYSSKPKATILCTKKSEAHMDGTRLSWEKIPDVSYYEVYQKLNNGEYKLLKTTKATACKFTTLKSGKKYTFAVKPVAVIPAANYDKEKDEGNYPETFTIEGTMSEDIVVKG